MALLSACSSDATTLADLGITDKPNEVVATALINGDVTAPLGREALLALVKIKLVPSGYSWADAGCAAEAIETVIGPEEFARIPMYRANTMAADYPGVTAAAEACESPETTARRNNTVTENDISIVSPLPGPDPDISEVRAAQYATFERGAAVAGLSDDELTCITDATLATWSDDDWVGAVVGTKRMSTADVERAVSDCLTPERLDEAAATAGQVLQDSQAQVREYLSTTTTVAGEMTLPPGAPIPPTTTVG